MAIACLPDVAAEISFWGSDLMNWDVNNEETARSPRSGTVGDIRQWPDGS